MDEVQVTDAEVVSSALTVDETEQEKNIRIQTCASEVDSLLIKYNCKIEVVNNVNVVSN